MDQRVVVTGIGIVSPIGIGRRAYWENLIAGRSGIAPITRFAVPEGGPHLAAAVCAYEPRDFIRSAHLRRMDGCSRMVVSAACNALDDAGIDRSSFSSEEIGIVIGTLFGDMSESTAHLDRLYGRGPGAVSPMIFPNLVLNAQASYVSMELGATGVNLTVTQGEASGEAALQTGFDLIRKGRARVVLAGGGDELSSIVYEVHRRARALSGSRGGEEWSSPYDVNRNGLVVGEGAAIFVLESAEQAREAGRHPYAEILASRVLAVPSHPYELPRDAADCVRVFGDVIGETCGGAGVDLFVGSANSSRELDGFEIGMFERLTANGTGRARLTSVKGAIGEFGSAGAFGVATGCLALRAQVIPPLCHLRAPASDKVQLLAQSEASPLRRVLCSTVARGGSAGIVVLQAPDCADSPA